MRYPLFTFLFAIVLLYHCGSNDVSMDILAEDSQTQTVPDRVDFNFHVKPILSDRCFACHGPDENKREAGLAFHDENFAFAALEDDPDHYAIVPGHPEKSALVDRIYTSDEKILMPPPNSNLKLTEVEKEILKKWIEQGAEWKEHWAFIPPEKPAIPEVDDRSWAQNDIDYFVFSKMQEHDLSPAEKASPDKLIRRASFDITGLPPHKEDVIAFIEDPSPAAFEEYIDKLFKTTAYAERMANQWLDIARYADTNGYQDDFERFNWPWRDWVIHAYRTNMPYDTFVLWQMAGDLLPSPSMEQIVATGFNRNHKITNEGGVIPEEYRVEYVADRTNTFGTAFLGMTMECSRCHDHKYDPISQENYFQLFSFFNNVDEEGYVPADVDPDPVIFIDHKMVDDVLSFINMPDSIERVRYMMMEEMKKPRQAYVLRRGAYDQPAEPVMPGTPDKIMRFGADFVPNRKGLTDWLFSEENPLTARVAVNRIWQQMFGKGIVSTPEDFGNQGSLPTHPELLDYLAIKYREDGWNTRDMIKYIMLSSTYQQSAASTPRKNQIDPENRWLSHSPRLRLSAEMIRDHALASSGLLVDKVGGPSVKPYQPKGLWEETTGGGGGSTAKYIEDEGSGLYRRSLYTFWKRTVPPPSLMTFDAASRDLCTVKRERTSTPLQALVLLNDPQYIEAMRVLAAKTLESTDPSDVDKVIQEIFFTTTSRMPTDEEITELRTYYNDQKSHFEKEKSKAKDFLEIGYSKPNDTIEPSTLAAYSSVALLIFNLDESINKG